MTKHRTAPSLGLLRKYYRYIPESGLFIHQRDIGHARFGAVAGCYRPDGYIQLSIDKRQYLAHQLAWYYVHEQWVPELDHKNRIRYDNRITNLRPAKRYQNNGNSAGWSQAKRKHKLPRGVYHYAQCPGAYRSQIVVNGRVFHLGCFSTIESAAAAYRKAAKLRFGEFSRCLR